MSERWSSYEKDGKIMESWRNYVEGPPTYRFLQEGPDYILTEQDLQELLGKANWEKLVDRFAIEDDGAAQLAQSLGLTSAEVMDAEGQVLDMAQISAKLKQVMNIARKSNDPELADAAQDLAQNAQQVAQGASAEQAIKDDDQGGTEGGQAQEQVAQHLEALAKASDLAKYKELYDKLTQLTGKPNQWFAIENWLKTGKDHKGNDLTAEKAADYISSFGQGAPPQPHHPVLSALLKKSQDQQSKGATSVDAAADAPAQGARDIKISASSRYGDATTLEDIAIQMLGLPGPPEPNKDKQQSRAVQQLTAKIMQAVKKALQNEFGSSLGAVQTTYENNQAEIEKLFMEELHKSRK